MLEINCISLKAKLPLPIIHLASDFSSTVCDKLASWRANTYPNHLWLVRFYQKTYCWPSERMLGREFCLPIWTEREMSSVRKLERREGKRSVRSLSQIGWSSEIQFGSNFKRLFYEVKSTHITVYIFIWSPFKVWFALNSHSDLCYNSWYSISIFYIGKVLGYGA